ncbi:MAG TPA: TldD/PmbA family protein, partial [Clostridiales bacterium]|nr:TldD/PmbA family protein [Clostridiales bacterium]
MTLYRFPDNLYTDVRIEKVYSTKILLENFEIKQNKTKVDTGAMIRIFDGRRWYYNATTEVNDIQAAIDNLATMAVPDPAIGKHPVVRRIEVNRGEHLRYADNPVHAIGNSEKMALLQTYAPILVNEPGVQKSRIYYLDNYTA